MEAIKTKEESENPRDAEIQKRSDWQKKTSCGRG